MTNTRKQHKEKSYLHREHTKKDDPSSTVLMQDLLRKKEQKVFLQLEKMGFVVETQDISEGMEKMIHYRHGEILEIGSNVEEILEMSKDIAQQVDEQGEKIDNVDKNLKDAKEHTSHAQVEIAKQDDKRSCVIL